MKIDLVKLGLDLVTGDAVILNPNKLVVRSLLLEKTKKGFKITLNRWGEKAIEVIKLRQYGGGAWFEDSSVTMGVKPLGSGKLGFKFFQRDSDIKEEVVITYTDEEGFVFKMVTKTLKGGKETLNLAIIDGDPMVVHNGQPVCKIKE